MQRGLAYVVLCCINRENCINTADTAHIVTIAVAAKLLTLSAVAQWLNAQAGTNTVIGSSLPDMEIFVNMSMVSNKIQHYNVMQFQCLDIRLGSPE